jgi:hypothetical protein
VRDEEDVTAYDELIASADTDFARGHFKEAHISYGQAVAMGHGRNHYCRQMRGTCARRVAEERLDKAVEQPDFRQAFLDQAALWLAKSEANLNSAFDESPDDELGRIRLEQAQTEEAIARFMEMSGGDPGRRQANARTYRHEGQEMLTQA